MRSYFGMVNTKKSRDYTPLAVSSFLARTDFDRSKGDRFFLIDNDGTLSTKLEEFSKELEVIENASPKSFAENANQILKLAINDQADLVFLNNDIVFTENWLSPLRKRRGSITIPACNQNELYGTDDFQLQAQMDLEDYIGHEAELAKIVRLRHNGLGASKRYTSPPFLPFYCFRLPLEVSKEVGLFDERFGIGGGEDIDYRIRAHLRGFQVELAKESYLLHFMGKSTWRGGETEVETHARNQLYARKFIEKYGLEMAKIFLFPDYALGQLEKLELLEEWSAQNYRSIIEHCISLGNSR
jgi:GT2 family glycosyltransferase